MQPGNGYEQGPLHWSKPQLATLRHAALGVLHTLGPCFPEVPHRWSCRHAGFRQLGGVCTSDPLTACALANNVCRHAWFRQRGGMCENDPLTASALAKNVCIWWMVLCSLQCQCVVVSRQGQCRTCSMTGAPIRNNELSGTHQATLF